MTITRYSQTGYDRGLVPDRDGSLVSHTDHLAALTEIERAAYERGVRDAAQMIDERLKGASTLGEWARGWVAGLKGTRGDILALLTQEGR